jgi:hypothetical protein
MKGDSPCSEVVSKGVHKGYTREDRGLGIPTAAKGISRKI